MANGTSPERQERLQELREDFTDRADVIDGGVRSLLSQMDLTRTDEDHERMIDALMGVSRAADALRALARQDFVEANEATTAMAHYAERAFG